jgi:hypothetical protein
MRSQIRTLSAPNLFHAVYKPTPNVVKVIAVAIPSAFAAKKTGLKPCSFAAARASLSDIRPPVTSDRKLWRVRLAGRCRLDWNSTGEGERVVVSRGRDVEAAAAAIAAEEEEAEEDEEEEATEEATAPAPGYVFCRRRRRAVPVNPVTRRVAPSELRKMSVLFFCCSGVKRDSDSGEDGIADEAVDIFAEKKGEGLNEDRESDTEMSSKQRNTRGKFRGTDSDVHGPTVIHQKIVF